MADYDLVIRNTIVPTAAGVVQGDIGITAGGSGLFCDDFESGSRPPKAARPRSRPLVNPPISS